MFGTEPPAREDSAPPSPQGCKSSGPIELSRKANADGRNRLPVPQFQQRPARILLKTPISDCAARHLVKTCIVPIAHGHPHIFVVDSPVSMRIENERSRSGVPTIDVKRTLDEPGCHALGKTPQQQLEIMSGAKFRRHPANTLEQAAAIKTRTRIGNGQDVLQCQGIRGPIELYHGGEPAVRCLLDDSYAR